MNNRRAVDIMPITTPIRAPQYQLKPDKDMLEYSFQSPDARAILNPGTSPFGSFVKPVKYEGC